MSDQAQTGLAGIAKFALGIAVVVFVMWTPKTGRGILIYAALVVLLIAGVAILSNYEKTGSSDEANQD
jgi:hypothetical protein